MLTNGIPLEYYLILSALFFVIGAIGVLTRKNIIIIFMCVELMLNSANLSLIAFSQYYGNNEGMIFVFFVMAVAAAEAAVGLAIAISMFRAKKTAQIDEFSVLNN